MPTDAISDGGQTLHLDIKGNTDTEGITLQDAACALLDLGMPSRVSQDVPPRRPWA